MKLVFEKKDPQTIKVKINHEGDIHDFDYVSMLKGLLDCGSLADSELKGDFSEAERNSIASMVGHLNDCVPVTGGQVNLDDDSDEESIESSIDEKL